MNFYEHPSQKPPEPSPEAAYQLGHMVGYATALRDAAAAIRAEGPWCNNPYHRTDDWRTVNDCPCYVYAASLVESLGDKP